MQRAQSYPTLLTKVRGLYSGATDESIFNCDPDLNNSTFGKIKQRATPKIRINLDYSNVERLFRPGLMTVDTNRQHFFPDVDSPDLIDGVNLRLVQFIPHMRVLEASNSWEDSEKLITPLFLRQGWDFGDLEMFILQIPRLVLDGILTLSNALAYEALSPETSDLVKLGVRKTTLAAIVTKMGALLRPIRKTIAHLQLSEQNPERRTAANAVHDIGKFEIAIKKIKARLEPFAISPRIRDNPIITKKSEMYKYSAIRRELIWWIQNTDANEDDYQREVHQLKKQAAVYAGTVARLQTEVEELRSQAEMSNQSNLQLRIRYLESNTDQLIQDNENLRLKNIELEKQLALLRKASVGNQRTSTGSDERSSIMGFWAVVNHPPLPIQTFL